MDDDGKAPDGEELAVLHEQLAEARADVERLQGDAANAVAEAAFLRDDVRASHDAVAAATAEAATLREQIDAATQRAQEAAERYRDLVVRTEPALPADLIAGSDIDAIDASVTAAREIVGRVRSHIESQAQAGRVPSGRAAAISARPERADARAEDPPRLGGTKFVGL